MSQTTGCNLCFALAELVSCGTFVCNHNILGIAGNFRRLHLNTTVACFFSLIPDPCGHFGLLRGSLVFDGKRATFLAAAYQILLCFAW